MSFKLMTDNTADLPVEFYKENDIEVLTLPVQVDDMVYDDYKTMDCKQFFQNMREGTLPTTSQLNPEMAKEGFLRELEKGNVKEILYIAFTSGMSGTYNNVRIAAEEIMEERPEVKIIVIDSLCAAMGEGLLVYKANLYKNQGHTLEETADYVEKIKLNSGRLSKILPKNLTSNKDIENIHIYILNQNSRSIFQKSSHFCLFRIILTLQILIDIC